MLILRKMIFYSHFNIDEVLNLRIEVSSKYPKRHTGWATVTNSNKSNDSQMSLDAPEKDNRSIVDDVQRPQTLIMSFASI